MHASLRPLSLSLALTLGCVALLPAAAQVTVSEPTPGTRRSSAQVIAPAHLLPKHNASIQGLRDNGPAALDRPVGAGWALAGFELRYGNGDHKLRRIGVMGEDRFVRFSLADSNGDDPFGGRAQLTALPGIRVREITAQGGGKFEIPLPGKAPPNSTLVLSGFEFRRADGTDANIRNIGVWMIPSRHVIQVSLTDDQGLDLRKLMASLGTAATSAVVPLPGILEAGSVAIAVETERHVVPKAGDSRYRPYQVTVQYAWVPNSMVAAKGALSGTHVDRSNPDMAGRARIDALQGFEFTFNNGDHHLLSLAVNPRATGTGTMRDNNTDDPMQWSATYLSLRAAPAP